MSDWGSELGVPIIVAFCAALLAYVFSVVVTRKGCLHDAKLTAYSRISGLYGETKEYLVSRSEFDAIDPSKKEPDAIMQNLMTLSTSLWYMGDMETASLFSDETALTKAIEGRGEEEFIKDLKKRAILMNTDRVMQNIRELAFRNSELALVRPSGTVVKALSDLLETLSCGNAIALKNLDKKFPGISRAVKACAGIPEETQKDLPGIEVWRKNADGAYATLVDAMKEDLRKTTRWL